MLKERSQFNPTLRVLLRTLRMMATSIWSTLLVYIHLWDKNPVICVDGTFIT